MQSVVGAFIDQFEDELKSADSNLAQQLLSANNTGGGSLSSFMDYPPDLTNILPLPVDEQTLYYGGMLLLAVCSFLKNCCHLVVIECQDEGIAFDMFQALNATGTPLTAFEVFKPLIVRVYGTAYASTIKSQVDRIDAVLENESTAGGKEELTDKVIGSSTLIYNGDEITRKFSEERDWLIDNFPTSASNASIKFMALRKN